MPVTGGLTQDVGGRFRGETRSEFVVDASQVFNGVNALIALNSGASNQVSVMAWWAALLAVLAAAGHLAGTWREDLIVRRSGIKK